MLLTSKQLSTRLQVSRTTLARWRDNGLPSIKMPGEKGAVRFEYDVVLNWLKSHGSYQEK